ncbi:MAG TPA: amidophosphoribosyltransferase [Armatimonadota bacterium]|nr:amidophosphoribosyltransferase [Armatimonadota bacterium]HOQ27460.1 amidophosphoribosyltransferase [Armatimonadota bacterium]HPT99257.1 amidophosphoribosyltransferase [Armatimonadota bacterium]
MNQAAGPGDFPQSFTSNEEADFLVDDDHPRDECGVFGICAPGEDVARLAYFGLFALQHRGQESAGIAVSDGRRLKVSKAMGLVTQVFDEEVLQSLRGGFGIGHVRYSTMGSSVLCNAQPVVVETPYGRIAVAHNGNLVNCAPLRDELRERGITFEGTNDSEVVAQLIARYHQGDLEEAIVRALARLEGAYALVILAHDKVVAARDPNGIRPLCLGALNHGHHVVASETCALNVVGARFMREVEPGEMVVIDADGVREFQAVPIQDKRLCLFEFIYFARPDSCMYGRSMHLARRRMGHILADEHPVDADVVIPVPDTGTPAAIGYAERSRIPFGEGLIKNRYIGRTFIQPHQRLRELGIRMKLTPLTETLAGKRVVMVDDSIVRGTTTRRIVRLLRDAGAREVHVRISSPPDRFPCHYGIDTGNRGELIAATLSVSQIREFIGADTLGYLSLRGVMRAIGLHRGAFCRACFDGQYPVSIPRDQLLGKFALETHTARGVAAENKPPEYLERVP